MNGREIPGKYLAYIGVFIFFIFPSRNPLFAESFKCLLAFFLQPVGFRCKGFANKRLELFFELGRNYFFIFCGRNHYFNGERLMLAFAYCVLPTAASFFIQSYPFSSSSRASSFPPDFTILPSYRICTKSGTM